MRFQKTNARLPLCCVILGAAIMPINTAAQPYSAAKTQIDGVDVVRLRNESDGSFVSIAPKIGAIAYEFIVNGKNAYWFPFDSVGEFAADPRLCGNPFLAP